MYEKVFTEFDQLQLGKFENGLHIPCTKEDYHTFLRTNFIPKEAVREEIKKLNKKVDYHPSKECEYNSALDDLSSALGL